MADLKTKSTSAEGREVILTKGAGTAIEDGDGVPFIGAIVNDLTTGGANAPLSAEQGVTLEAIKLALAGGTMTGLLRATEGINFNASGGDTLDDYEEGTWTPTFGSQVNLTGTPAASSFKFTRIGNQVFIEGNITGLSITSASTFTGIVITLPIASLINNIPSVGSARTSGTGAGVVVNNSGANNTEVFIAFHPSVITVTGSVTISFSFNYIV